MSERCALQRGLRQRVPYAVAMLSAVALLGIGIGGFAAGRAQVDAPPQPLSPPTLIFFENEAGRLGFPPTPVQFYQSEYVPGFQYIGSSYYGFHRTGLRVSFSEMRRKIRDFYRRHPQALTKPWWAIEWH